MTVKESNTKEKKKNLKMTYNIGAYFKEKYFFEHQYISSFPVNIGIN